MRSSSNRNRRGPLHAPSGRPHAFSIGAFAIGSGLAMCFFAQFLHPGSSWSLTGLLAVAFLSAVSTTIWISSGMRTAHTPARRWIGRFCTVVLAGLYAFWCYLAASFGVLLAWTASSAACVLVAALAVGSIVTSRRQRERLRVPFVLPLGAWIAIVLSGWLREDALVRCDDLSRLESTTQLLLPSHPDLRTCRPGDAFPTGRFPRTFWESPDGRRVVFTTQGTYREGGLDGTVCDVTVGDGNSARCIGSRIGKAHGIVDLEAQGRLLILTWGVRGDDGRPQSVLYEIPRDERLRIVEEHRFAPSLAQGFFEPRSSTLYTFSDIQDAVRPFTLPGYQPQEPIPLMFFNSDELHYDGATNEGVACGHRIGAAIRGGPFAIRYFAGDDAELPEKLSVTWGCDWDRASGKVYTAVPNLGLLDEIDYASGRVLHRWFVGFGMRSVAFDGQRRRVYMADFLRGEVVAFDLATERVTRRWFVGHFSRWVRVTRDGRALIATGNLGIVRIPLESP